MFHLVLWYFFERVLRAVSVILNRVMLSESQCDFRQDQALLAWFLLLANYSTNVPGANQIYLCHRFKYNKGIWYCLSRRIVENHGKLGCLDKFISMVRLFHDGMRASVRIWHAAQHGFVLVSLRQLWFDHQYQRIYVPTSSWTAMYGTHYHCKGAKALCCLTTSHTLRVLYLPLSTSMWKSIER